MAFVCFHCQHIGYDLPTIVDGHFFHGTCAFDYMRKQGLGYKPLTDRRKLYVPNDDVPVFDATPSTSDGESTAS